MPDYTINYTPKEMLEAMQLRPRPTTWLSDTLVKREETSDKTAFQIDQDFGTQTKAGYTSRKGDPTEIGKKGYNSAIHIAPYIDERITLTPDDVDVRDMGTDEYSTNANSIMDRRVARWLADLQDRYIRAEEDQIAEILQTGKLHVQGVDVDYEIDYGIPNDHIVDVSGSTPWNNSDYSKIGMIESWAQKVADDGGMTITDIIYGFSAGSEWLKDEEVLSLLNNRRVERGRQEILNNSRQRVSNMGPFAIQGVDFESWSYQGGYHGGGQFNRFIDPKKVILIARDIEIERKYGKIENFNANFIGKRFVNFYGDGERGKKRYIEMESSPLTILRDPISIFVATVLP